MDDLALWQEIRLLKIMVASQEAIIKRLDEENELIKIRLSEVREECFSEIYKEHKICLKRY